MNVRAVNENSVDTPDNALEIAIGAEVRGFRRRLNLTLTEVSQLTGLSGAMLSKIENGQTSASLSTLKTLARHFCATTKRTTELPRHRAGVASATPSSKRSFRCARSTLIDEKSRA